MGGSIRAQRARARSALFWRVLFTDEKQRLNQGPSAGKKKWLEKPLEKQCSDVNCGGASNEGQVSIYL